LVSSTGTKIRDVYVGQYQQIGTTKDSFFVDATVQPGQPYMYYVLAEARDGKVSDQSNLTAFPPLVPSVTFAQLLHEVDVLDQRRRFKDQARQLTQMQKMILGAQRHAESCHVLAALSKLNPEKAYSEVLEPDAMDLEILLAKLVRRLELF